MLAALVLALSLQDGAANDPLQPLRFLTGNCWRGEFANSQANDLMCVEDMPGGHLRARHVVRGAPGDYRGETIYHFDGERRAIRLHYYTSAGAFMQADMIPQDDGSISIANARHVGPDGRALHMIGTITPLGPNRFASSSRFFVEGRWTAPDSIEMVRIDCADWQAVEAGCDGPNRGETR